MTSESIPFLIFRSILVFQLSSFVTWSNSKTAPVNASISPASMASTRMLTNLASLVEVKVVSSEPYLDRFRLAVTVSCVEISNETRNAGGGRSVTYLHRQSTETSAQPVLLHTILCKSG